MQRLFNYGCFSSSDRWKAEDGLRCCSSVFSESWVPQPKYTLLLLPIFFLQISTYWRQLLSQHGSACPLPSPALESIWLGIPVPETYASYLQLTTSRSHRKISSFSGVSLGTQTILKGGPHAQQVDGQDKRTQQYFGRFFFQSHIPLFGYF